jgi:hypothetical protein
MLQSKRETQLKTKSRLKDADTASSIILQSGALIVLLVLFKPWIQMG